MKIAINYQHLAGSHQEAEVEVVRLTDKLERLLKCYEPDLVQLHGVFSHNPHREEHSFSLNLSLPTGTLHAIGTAETARACCKKAFSEIETQVKKHQSLLRHDHEWKRKRARPKVAEAE